MPRGTQATSSNTNSQNNNSDGFVTSTVKFLTVGGIAAGFVASGGTAFWLVFGGKMAIMAGCGLGVITYNGTVGNRANRLADRALNYFRGNSNAGTNTNQSNTSVVASTNNTADAEEETEENREENDASNTTPSEYSELSSSLESVISSFSDGEGSASLNGPESQSPQPSRRSNPSIASTLGSSSFFADSPKKELRKRHKNLRIIGEENDNEQCSTSSSKPSLDR